jgi:hypothetical protein
MKRKKGVEPRKRNGEKIREGDEKRINRPYALGMY